MVMLQTGCVHLQLRQGLLRAAPSKLGYILDLRTGHLGYVAPSLF